MSPVFRLGMAALLAAAALEALAGSYVPGTTAGSGEALQPATDPGVCGSYQHAVNMLVAARGPQTCGREVPADGTGLRPVAWTPLRPVPELAYVLARVRQPNEALWPASYRSLIDFSAGWKPGAHLSYSVTPVALADQSWQLLRVVERKPDTCEHRPDGSGGRRQDLARYYLFPAPSVERMIAVDPAQVVDLQRQGNTIAPGYGDAFSYRGRIYLDKLRSWPRGEGGTGYSLTLSELSYIAYLERPSLVDVCALEYR